MAECRPAECTPNYARASFLETSHQKVAPIFERAGYTLKHYSIAHDQTGRMSKLFQYGDVNHNDLPLTQPHVAISKLDAAGYDQVNRKVKMLRERGIDVQFLRALSDGDGSVATSNDHVPFKVTESYRVTAKSATGEQTSKDFEITFHTISNLKDLPGSAFNSDKTRNQTLLKKLDELFPEQSPLATIKLPPVREKV